MMCLARRERRKALRVYRVDVPVSDPRAWRFSPRLGSESQNSPSTLCAPGIAALGRTLPLALAAFYSAEATEAGA